MISVRNYTSYVQHFFTVHRLYAPQHGITPLRFKQQKSTKKENMDRAGFDVIVSSFEKHGTVYHAAITTPTKNKKDDCKIQEYKVLLSRPQSKTVSFKIKFDEQGRWIPDKRRLIDPWIADQIGEIIEHKIINKL